MVHCLPITTTHTTPPRHCVTASHEIITNPQFLQVISTEFMNVGHDYNGKDPLNISHGVECESITVGVLLQPRTMPKVTEQPSICNIINFHTMERCSREFEVLNLVPRLFSLFDHHHSHYTRLPSLLLLGSSQ